MKARKDSFFGLHFDFHANKNSGVIGKGFDAKVMEELLDRVRPDFVQCDTKGHPGLSSYPTKAGNPAPSLEGDPLKEWRRITRKYDTALYAHYSGCFDQEVIKQNPSWGIVWPSGEKSTDFVSLNSDYDKEVLIPQFVELATIYDLDGLWVDGECWSAHYDIGELSKEAFKKSTGKNYEDVEPSEYLEFLRECFRNHVRNYVKAGHDAKANFQICSNWMYSSQVPEEPNTGVDYISCDLYPTNSLEGSRLETRICQGHDLPWDIMSWGFSFPTHHQKSVLQLCQEAAFIISMGGGFQVYEEEAPSCSMKDPSAIEKLSKISKFARDREEFVHYNTPICDTALIYSTKNYYYNNKDRLFGDMGRYNIDCKGMIDALLENQIPTEVILTYKALKNDLSKYRLLVLGNLDVIESELKSSLLDYVSNGGNLLLAGPDSINLFNDVLNLEVVDKLDDAHFKLLTSKYEVELAGSHSIIDYSKANKSMYLGEATVDLKNCSLNPPPTIYFNKLIPSYIKVNYGKGNFRVVTFDLGTTYFKEKTYQLRDFLYEVIQDIPQKLCVKGSHLVDTNINTKNGKDYIHLMNYGGPHESTFVKTYDELQPIYNLEISYEINKEVKSLTLQPEGLDIPFLEEEGKIKFALPKLDIYAIIEIAYK